MADPKHPRHYDEAFKRQIVQSCENGKPSREIRAEYDIARSTPRRWAKASATAAPPGPRTTARPSRTSRSGRGSATGSWRWRWTFQNKRRRYSHEGRRDTGRRGQAREPAGPAGPTATPRTRIRRAILPMSASAEAGRTCACWPAWRTGASPAIPPGGPGTRAWYWARSPPSTSR